MPEPSSFLLLREYSELEKAVENSQSCHLFFTLGMGPSPFGQVSTLVSHQCLTVFCSS